MSINPFPAGDRQPHLQNTKHGDGEITIIMLSMGSLNKIVMCIGSVESPQCAQAPKMKGDHIHPHGFILTSQNQPVSIQEHPYKSHRRATLSSAPGCHAHAHHRISSPIVPKRETNNHQFYYSVWPGIASIVHCPFAPPHEQSLMIARINH